MKWWAVSHIAFHDNHLTTQFMQAQDWRLAAIQHIEIAKFFSIDPADEDNEDADKHFLPDTLLEAKQLAFDCDAMIEVVQIPDDLVIS